VRLARNGRSDARALDWPCVAVSWRSGQRRLAGAAPAQSRAGALGTRPFVPSTGDRLAGARLHDRVVGQRALTRFQTHGAGSVRSARGAPLRSAGAALANTGRPHLADLGPSVQLARRVRTPGGRVAGGLVTAVTALTGSLLDQKPRVAPPLDIDFRPAALAERAYLTHVRNSGSEAVLEVALERHSGQVARARTEISTLADDAAVTQRYVERWLKFLLWQHGAWRVFAAGPNSVIHSLMGAYAPGGLRQFDAEFMSSVYRAPFEIVAVDREQLPEASRAARRASRSLSGCRIGFDAG